MIRDLIQAAESLPRKIGFNTSAGTIVAVREEEKEKSPQWIQVRVYQKNSLKKPSFLPT